VIVLDTCALVYDALTPQKLTAKAKSALLKAEKSDQLFCCDISLWEIGMLIQKKRLSPGTDTENFLLLLLQARKIKVLDINIEIAAIATADERFNHFDPADRLIAATAIHYQAKLITSDQYLKNMPELTIIW
jgi:PIN domain nuclease of toxin-antitoxin system